jgi:peptidoglycan glycosyltransferase
MNSAIVRLFGVSVLLFALLIVWTSRWTVFEASALNSNPLNKRPSLAQLLVKRGRILASDGEVLARSVPARGGTWNRRYPTRSLFAQVVGYSIAAKGELAGLERSRSGALLGSPGSVSAVFGPLTGSGQVGNDVHTTLDPTAQRLAVQLLAGRDGAVVALDPRNGDVEVLYANPTYDDNQPNDLHGGSLFDSALQAESPPGSTFKVVTAAAALDTGRYNPDSLINGKSPIIESGVPLENDNNTSYGEITLTRALTDSVNTVFAQVGVKLGIGTLANYMKRFGFYRTPPLDFPADEMNASGERLKGELISPTSNQIDVGRMAIGQDKLAVTPLQMAMVAAAVANGGTLMTPHITSRVVNQDGQTIQTVTPTVYSHVMKPSTARALTSMMTDVVEEGTGQAANLGASGVQVAGKTGTAQIGATGSNLTEPWFIGFAPASAPRIAIAVTIDKTVGGYGGTVAAPIAAQLIKLLLAEGK